MSRTDHTLKLGLFGIGLDAYWPQSVKHGPVTLLSVVQTVDGRLKLLDKLGKLLGIEVAVVIL
jgi:hypothetical protein